jgi:hypothetical protein
LAEPILATGPGVLVGVPGITEACALN